jgi:pilus assembly protein CpaB
LKRSNRLIILVGIILAVIVAGGVFLLTQGGGTGGETGGRGNPTTQKVAVATQPLTLGTVIDASTMLTTKDIDVTTVPAGAVTDPASVNGFVLRRDVLQGDVIVDSDFTVSGQVSNQDILKNLKKGFRAMAVQVDQVTGVGTLIQPGDYVDIVLTMEGTDNKFPVIVEKAPTREGSPLTTVRNFAAVNNLLNATSVKVLVQNVQVLGALLPPPETTSGQQPAPSSNPGSSGTALNGQQEIVILALTPEQVELTRFVQLDGNLSLVLRSTADKDSAPDATGGTTLRILVDKWGVVVPKMVLSTQP